MDWLLELLLIDEADRLNVKGLEVMSDLYDWRKMGLVLIGMPGIEKKLSRYAQLYSRVGFVHQFRSLHIEEVRKILEEKWKDLEIQLNIGDFADEEAMAAILRTTGGNFRLVERLLMQIERLLVVNDMKMVTKEFVDAARENLIIGIS